MLQLKDVSAEVRFVCLTMTADGPLGVVKIGKYIEEVQPFLREGRTLMQRSPLVGGGWVDVQKCQHNQACRVRV